MSKLMQVRSGGCLLMWPESLQQDNEKVRGLAGYVVDLDAPLEQEWCKGQEHKLTPAPATAKPNALSHPQAIRSRKAEEKRLAEAPPAGDLVEVGANASSGAGEPESLEVVRPAAKRKAS